MLHRLLLTQGISPPPRQARIINAPEPEGDVYYPSSYTVTKPSGLGQPLQLHFPQGMGQDLSQSLSPGEGARTSASPAGRGPTGQLSPGGPSSLAGSKATTPVSASGLGPAAIDKVHGIDFVLGYASVVTS